MRRDYDGNGSNFDKMANIPIEAKETEFLMQKPFGGNQTQPLPSRPNPSPIQ